MPGEHTDCIGSLIRVRDLSKIEHSPDSYPIQKRKSIFRLRIRHSCKFAFQEPVKVRKYNLPLLIFSEIILLQAFQWTLHELLSKGRLKVRPYFYETHHQSRARMPLRFQPGEEWPFLIWRIGWGGLHGLLLACNYSHRSDGSAYRSDG